MSLKVFILLLLFSLAAVWGEEPEEPPSGGKEAPTDGEVPMKLQEKAVAYLKKYGYLRNGYDGSLQTLEDAIKNMQIFGGLKATGQLNEETAALMEKSRCGVADFEERDTRSKRYATSNKKWSSTDLTYKTWDYPSKTEDMTPTDVDAAIAAGFKKWSDAVTTLKFTKTDGIANLNIKFSAKDHGDVSKFDGQGNVLGHAFYPTVGKIHFDKDETWVKTTPKDPSAKYLEYVVCHEIGHALGLKHTDKDPPNVMRAYYTFNLQYELGLDDIEGMKFLYG